jgi:hypothetical protein
VKRRLFTRELKLPDRNPFRVGKTYLVQKSLIRQSTYSKGYESDYVPPPFIVAKEGGLVYVKKIYDDLTFQVLTCNIKDQIVFDSLPNSSVLSMDEMFAHISKNPFACNIEVVKQGVVK